MYRLCVKSPRCFSKTPTNIIQLSWIILSTLVQCTQCSAHYFPFRENFESRVTTYSLGKLADLSFKLSNGLHFKLGAGIFKNNFTLYKTRFFKNNLISLSFFCFDYCANYTFIFFKRKNTFIFSEKSP